MKLGYLFEILFGILTVYLLGYMIFVFQTV